MQALTRTTHIIPVCLISYALAWVGSPPLCWGGGCFQSVFIMYAQHRPWKVKLTLEIQLIRDNYLLKEALLVPQAPPASPGLL